MKNLVSALSLFTLLVFSFLSTNDACGFNAAHECRDFTSMSNYALKFFSSLGTVSDLRNIFQEMNIVRTVGSEGHSRTQRFIKGFLRNLGWHIEVQNFTSSTPWGDKSFSNIVGSSSENAPYRVVLACHYDSKDFGSQLGGKPFYAATDSAVPCAIMLHVASTLRAGLAKRKDLSLDLVFFDGEEAFGEWTDSNSIYGAKQLAAAWQNTNHAPLTSRRGGRCSRMQSIGAFVLLDLIGERGMQFHNLYSDNSCSTALYDLLKFNENRLRTRDLIDTSVQNIFTSGMHRDGAGMQDDHLPFKAAGVNIVHLIAVPFPSVWHTEHDNEAALDWPSIWNLDTILRTAMASYFDITPKDLEMRGS